MLRTPLSRRTAISLGVSLALTAPAAVLAQPQEAQMLEEVLVTATKRSASVQEISVSVSAFSADDIMRGGIEDITRLGYMVPGMKVGQSGNELRLAMRGTRQNNVGTEAEQVVGIFEDGVYVPTTTQALGSYVDLDRIEVLRGPQGTLYGRNTFGGTVNIHTKAPTLDETKGYVTGLYGDYDRTKLEGAVNVPLGDTVAVRLAGMIDEHDGYIENHYPGVDDLRDQDLSYYRASILWAPNDSFDATFRYAYMDQTSTSDAIWGYQHIGAYTDGVFAKGNQLGTPGASDNFDQGPWDVRRNLPSNADTESNAYTLSVNYRIDGLFDVKFIGNITDFEGNQNFDSDYSDGGDADNNGFTGWKSDQDTWSTELQLVSNGEGPLEWMLGAYYFDQDSDWNWQSRENGQFIVPHWDQIGNYTSNSTGYFANATFAVSDELRLIAGYRYAEDEKQQKNQLDWSVFPPIPAPGTGSEGDWDKDLWKGGVEYDLNEDSMAYLQVSTGYRAGGINAIDPNIPLTFEPETVTAYEVGYKSTWMDSSLVFNVAAYYNEFEDMQAQSFVNRGGNTFEFTESGGEIDTYGVEVEFTWLPIDNMRIQGTLAYMDSEFGDYDISWVAGLDQLESRRTAEGNLSLEDMTPALSPEWTSSLQASYDFHLPGGSVLMPLIQIAYSDEYNTFDIELPEAEQDSYTMADARLIWTSPSENIEAQAFVLNIGDEEVITRSTMYNDGAAPTIASVQSSWNNPRTWGVSATYSF
jgi:iron complex outermembrane receptor protein